MIIRELKETDKVSFENFLYLAIHQEIPNTLPFETIYESRIYAYIKGWGMKDDVAFVALHNEKVIGMAWSRIIGEGYGNIDNKTPELAIAVIDEYRNKGIGTMLVNGLLKRLKELGYKEISLSVDKSNNAKHLYERTGFVTIKENSADYLMINKI